MIDVELKARLLVHTEGSAGPYLLVPVQQVGAVEAVLREADVRFSTARDAIQMGDHDAIALIDFGRRADPSRVQAILDQH